ncbi:MAG: TRAP transporter substrate-binding protein DctP [Planctomycetota bacterium]|nr:TRAP transporter substrate-binding protein DctP [Planctomycetota bacterium]
MRKRTRRFAAAAFAFFVLPAFAATSMAAEIVVSLVLAASGPDGSLDVRMAEAIGQAIGREGGGRLAIQMLSMGEDADSLDLHEALVNGSADIAVIDVRNLGAAIPDFAPLALPFILPDFRAADHFLQNGGAARMADVAGKHDIAIAGWFAPRPVYLFSKKPLSSVTDFKELRIAATRRLSAANTLGILGASPIFLSGRDILDGSRQGTVDAVETDCADLADLALPSELAGGFVLGHSFVLNALCYAAVIPSTLGTSLNAFRRGLEAGLTEAGEVVNDALASGYERLAAKGLPFQPINPKEMRDLVFANPEEVFAGGDKEILDLLAAELKDADGRTGNGFVRPN